MTHYKFYQLQLVELLPGNWVLSVVLIGVGIALIWISVIATLVSGVQYIWNLRHYFKEN